MAKKDEFGETKFTDEKIRNPDVETLRSALAKLGLRIIDDINAKRVHKPEAVYDALVAIFNAIK